MQEKCGGNVPGKNLNWKTEAFEKKKSLFFSSGFSFSCSTPVGFL